MIKLRLLKWGDYPGLFEQANAIKGFCNREAGESKKRQCKHRKKGGERGREYAASSENGGMGHKPRNVAPSTEG